MEGVSRVHFVGVGGIGMSGLAKILLAKGIAVSGSDLRLTSLTEALRAQGAAIYEGHDVANVNGADLVVVSSAVQYENPEWEEARRRQIQVIKRSELLANLMNEKLGVAVSGTHGKTTTSSLLSFLLEKAGLDPTIIVGGEMIDLGSNAKLGQGPHLVAEADEYDASFLRLSPHLAVVTNVDADHLDFYGTYEGIVVAFAQFLDRVAADGTIVVCSDDPGLILTLTRMGRAMSNQGIQGEATIRVVTYGLQPGADWQATEVVGNDRGGNDFTLTVEGESRGVFSNSLPGSHNVANALGAIAAANSLGVDLEAIRDSLPSFRGTKRRFEVMEVAGVTIIDDYGHHPVEIKATLQAVRKRFGDRNLVCVFQPHTYSRTKHLFPEFAACFGEVDTVVVTPIYAAREHDTLGISSEDLVRAIGGPPAHYVPNLEAAADLVLDWLRPGDILLTIGAGDVNRVGQAVAERLTERHAQE